MGDGVTFNASTKSKNHTEQTPGSSWRINILKIKFSIKMLVHACISADISTRYIILVGLTCIPKMCLNVKNVTMATDSFSMIQLFDEVDEGNKNE